ncbi:MAG: Kae1-associated serine/threonine protein kinase [Nitrososphaerales archaeon]|nr:Kae1-associated serine/threonine protein kinase [Nitrososphaerales archaeon]
MILSTFPGEAEATPGRLIHKGAEADILLGRWSGRPAVYKVRRPLPYRLKALDQQIRRHRTVHEAEMIHSAKAAGVAAPFLYFVSQPDATLVMEFIEGERLKDAAATRGKADVVRLFEQLGGEVAKLHAAGVMHGDVTTANVIMRCDELVFIDFGLSIHSTRLEDRAVDLRLIKETVTGAHSSVAVPAMDALLKGYGEVAGEQGLEAVVRQLRQIERRGRYARVE